jgi:hypothetical protein
MSIDKKESLTKALENTMEILKAQGMGANANAVQAVIGLYRGFPNMALMFDNDLKEAAPWTGEPDSQGILGSVPDQPYNHVWESLKVGDTKPSSGNWAMFELAVETGACISVSSVNLAERCYKNYIPERTLRAIDTEVWAFVVSMKQSKVSFGQLKMEVFTDQYQDRTVVFSVNDSTFIQRFKLPASPSNFYPGIIHNFLVKLFVVMGDQSETNVQTPTMSEKEWGNVGKDKLSLLIKNKVITPIRLFDIYTDNSPPEGLFGEHAQLKLLREVSLAMGVFEGDNITERALLVVLPKEGEKWITLFFEDEESIKSLLDLAEFAYLPHALSMAIDYLQKYIVHRRKGDMFDLKDLIITGAGINRNVDMSSVRPQGAPIADKTSVDNLNAWYEENMQRLHEEPGFLDMSKQNNTPHDSSRPMFLEEPLGNHDPDVKMTVEGMIHSECGVALDYILPDRALLRSVASVVASVTETVDYYPEADATQAIVFSVLYDYLSKQVQAEYAVEGAAQDMLKYCEDFANRFSHQQGLTSDSAVYVTIHHDENGLPASLKVVCNRPDIVYALDLTQFRFEHAAVYFVLSTLINDRLYLKDHLLAMEVEHAVNAVTSRAVTQ